MKFLTGITAALVASTVNAAALIGRGSIGDSVQACVNDIQSTNAPLNDFIGQLTAFDPDNDPYQQLFSGVSAETSVEKALNASAISCGEVTNTYTDDESTAVTAAFSSYALLQESALEILVDRFSVYDSVPVVAPMWKLLISRLNNLVDSVTPLLVSATPSSGLAPLQSSIDSLSAKFDTATAAYAQVE